MGLAVGVGLLVGVGCSTGGDEPAVNPREVQACEAWAALSGPSMARDAAVIADAAPDPVGVLMNAFVAKLGQGVSDPTILRDIRVRCAEVGVQFDASA